MNQKRIWILEGTGGGVAAVGAAAVVIWNSKQMRTARRMKLAGRLLYKMGAALQCVTCPEQGM